MGVYGRLPKQPTWATGVQLVRVARDSLHLVGDIENPVALTGAPEALLDWLTQLCGDASWEGQLADAAFRGADVSEAAAVLKQLWQAGLLVDALPGPVVDPAGLVLIGSGRFAEPMTMLGLPPEHALVLPAGCSRGDWTETVDAAIDHDKLVVLALQGVTAHSVEVTAAQAFSRAGRDYLVLGAGPHTARVGPLVRAPIPSCLNCEVLARCDLDPAWSEISAVQASSSDPPEPDPVLIALAAAEGVRQIQTAGSGTADCEAAVLQTGHRGGPWWRRPLHQHPRCECWLAAVA